MRIIGNDSYMLIISNQTFQDDYNTCDVNRENPAYGGENKTDQSWNGHFITYEPAETLFLLSAQFACNT